jgi:farnesyl diphosphate synthase
MDPNFKNTQQTLPESGLRDPGYTLEKWAQLRRAAVEAALHDLLDQSGAQPISLREAMDYAVLGGGKRIRPLLVYAAGALPGAPLPALDLAASAVELIHAYSLVHDDMPCMDNDILRRGKPTVHVAYGEAIAMLVGDGLQALAFEALANLAGQGIESAAIVRMIAELARACGPSGMVGGQAIDLSSVGHALSREQLEAMHRAKTGAILKASVRLGWLAGGLPVPPELDRYADALGLAFQVIDDLLDVQSDTATLGKTAGKDSAHNKPTFVSLLGVEGARALAGSLRDEAVLAVTPFRDRARRLVELADRVINRGF